MVAFKRGYLIHCEPTNHNPHHTLHHSDTSAVPRGIGGGTPSHVMAVPTSQHSQHYGERAITQVDYDGVPTVRNENFMRPRRRSRSRTRHRRSSRHSSNAPDITIQRK